MKWDKKYRPQTFDEVAGQDYAVRLLSGLITRRSGGRHLLLYGAVGSGKTSLARIFARGLNCAQPDAIGSPCQSCAACTDVGTYLLEYDVPGRSGERDKVAPWLEVHCRKPTESRVKIIFFDEAHALTRATQDLLLKRVEDAAPGVIFCFATTEVDRIIPALRSRLMEVPIREISTQTAVDRLQTIAIHEGISCDRAALYLLAAAKPPYLRDLVIGLETLHGLEKHIDTALVQEVFDLDAASHVARYWRALARGDLDAQATELARWPDGVDAKVRWIRLFLTTMYYNDVLGQHVVLDPLVHSQEQERGLVVRLFREQLRLRSARELVPLFETMLDFWGESPADSADVLQLQLARFQSLVNRSLEIRDDGDRIQERENSVPETTQTADSTGRELEVLPARPGSQYINIADARLIVNRASFLPQHHGKYLNVLCLLETQLHQAGSEAAAFAWVVSATDAFTKICVEHENESACIVVVERQGSTVVARIAATVPNELTGSIRARLEDWWNSPNGTVGSSWDLRCLATDNPQPFHRSVVLELCAGFTAAVEDAPIARAFEQEVKRCRQQLREPGPFEYPRLMFWSLLTTKSIEAACEHGLAPLSAIDDYAWSSIFDGWESNEYQDRVRHIEGRRNAISELLRRFQEDPIVLRKHVAELEAQWAAQDPWERTRTWRGWR